MCAYKSDLTRRSMPTRRRASPPAHSSRWFLPRVLPPTFSQRVSRIALLETSASNFSPRLGKSQPFSASRQPEIVAGFTGRRFRDLTETSHQSACWRNVTPGAVFSWKDSFELMPSRSRNSRSRWRATDLVRQTPRGLVRRFRSELPGRSCQYFP